MRADVNKNIFLWKYFLWIYVKQYEVSISTDSYIICHLLRSPVDTTTRWQRFLQSKFVKTEKKWPSLEQLPDSRALEDFLKDGLRILGYEYWQAGFRVQRGCRDNSMILRTLCQREIELGQRWVHVDRFYRLLGGFWHRFTQIRGQNSKKAGSPVKIRAMFKPIYITATAHTTTEGADGEIVKCVAFPIRIGVLQGDITSPLYFTITLALLLRTHTWWTHWQKYIVSLINTIVHTLDYADDVALIDYGDTAGIIE